MLIKSKFGLPTIAFLAVLGGCETAPDQNPGPCPPTGVLGDADRQIEFVGAPILENVAYTAEISSARSLCRYWSDRPIRADLEITVAFGRGPAGLDKRHDYEYFVAVTGLNRLVLAKEVMEVRINFGDDAIVERTFEFNNVVIPRAREGISGENFEILVGMNLTPEQVAFNRSGKSLRFPEL